MAGGMDAGTCTGGANGSVAEAGAGTGRFDQRSTASRDCERRADGCGCVAERLMAHISSLSVAVITGGSDMRLA